MTSPEMIRKRDDKVLSRERLYITCMRAGIVTAILIPTLWASLLFWRYEVYSDRLLSSLVFFIWILIVGGIAEAKQYLERIDSIKFYRRRETSESQQRAGG